MKMTELTNGNLDRLNCKCDLDFEEQWRFTACVSEFCQHPPDVEGLVQQPLQEHRYQANAKHCLPLDKAKNRTSTKQFYSKIYRR